MIAVVQFYCITDAKTLKNIYICIYESIMLNIPFNNFNFLGTVKHAFYYHFPSLFETCVTEWKAKSPLRPAGTGKRNGQASRHSLLKQRQAAV